MTSRLKRRSSLGHSLARDTSVAGGANDSLDELHLDRDELEEAAEEEQRERRARRGKRQSMGHLGHTVRRSIHERL